jgi:cytosine/adenosine deaminase-related metal-dependent hydrolase
VLFENGTVTSFDDENEDLKIIRDTSVLVVGDRIAAIFDSSSPCPIALPSNAEKVSTENKIISPGFIDTHRHGWQTAYRTIAANTTLAEYFKHYSQFSQAAKVFTPEDIYFGQPAGIYECLNAGVTSAFGPLPWDFLSRGISCLAQGIHRKRNSDVVVLRLHSL